MPAFGVVRVNASYVPDAGMKVCWLMLCGSSRLGCRFLAVTLIEAIDASGGIDELLFAGKERVASRTDFYVQVTFLRGAGLERISTRAGNGYFVVFGMNSWFHFVTLYRRPQAAFSNRV